MYIEDIGNYSPSAAAGLRQTDIGYEQFKRSLLATDLFVSASKSWHITTICSNCASCLLTYLLTLVKPTGAKMATDARTTLWTRAGSVSVSVLPTQAYYGPCLVSKHVATGSQWVAAAPKFVLGPKYNKHNFSSSYHFTICMAKSAPNMYSLHSQNFLASPKNCGWLNIIHDCSHWLR